MYPVQSYKQAFCFRGDIIHFRPLVHAYYADMHVPDPMPDPIPGQIPILLAFFFFYSFVPHTSLLWNGLLDHIVSCTSFHSFKHSLMS